MAFITRTPWTLEDDLAGILRQKSRTLDLPFKAAVNTALRKGLASEMKEVEDSLRKAGRDAAS